MRLAFLADIHGNLPAFEAVLDHARRQRPDQIIIVGDIVVGSPDSRACLELAHSLGCPIVRGNHERYVASFGQPNAPAAWQSNQYAPVRWAHGQLTPEQHAAIGTLPQFLRLADCPDLLIVHHQSVPYDHEAALVRFHETGYLEAAGPMARLFMREVATAAGQIVPFLRDYERWNATKPITLEAAVERFF